VYSRYQNQNRMGGGGGGNGEPVKLVVKKFTLSRVFYLYISITSDVQYVKLDYD
jgi:hypothetical protein